MRRSLAATRSTSWKAASRVQQFFRCRRGRQLVAYGRSESWRGHMKRAACFLMVIGVALGTKPVQAHHSFAATYFEDKVQKIEGNLVQFLYRNPHSFVHIEAPDDKGDMQRWAVEWGAGQQLTQQGVTRVTLKAGDHVVVEGSPGRNPEDHRLRMRSIVRPA